MRIDLTGRRALVAGGSRGIGRGVVEALAACGAEVVIGDTLVDTAAETAAGLRASGLDVDWLPLDVTQPAAWDRVVADAGPLDALIYAAGIMQELPFLAADAAFWQRVQDVNCTGFRHGAAALLPQMIARRQGVLLALGSVWSQRPLAASPAYCVSKAALLMLVRCLALAHAPDNVRVCAINPGWVDTPGEREKHPEDPHWTIAAAAQQPLQRLTTPRDVGQAAAFLCSPLAAAVTGVVLPVDCGAGLL